MIEKDLSDPQDWTSFAPAGAEQNAEMVLLSSSDNGISRSVLVRFPVGWERPVTGNQPAGEEMVVLEGALSMSGHVARPGHVLMVEPRATRADTRTATQTRAVVWFSGAAGGWVEGEAEVAGTITVAALGEGVVRSAGAIPGSIEVRDGADLGAFDVAVDVVWTQAQTWVRLEPGEAAPPGAGPAVIRRWA